MTVNIRQLSTAAADFDTEFQRLQHWSAETDHAIEERVAGILDDVRLRGDAAVLEYTERFDGLKATSVAALEITRAELRAALAAAWRRPCVTASSCCSSMNSTSLRRKFRRRSTA